jgi:crotonobetainyl-CoA:carnitine CoA-transferase CaiB-like acyl-CoA transferase
LAADTRFLDPSSRNANRKDALAYVQAWTTAQPSRAACIAALDAAGVPCAAVQRIDEVMADPQTNARGMVVEQDHPVAGRVKLPNLPFRFSECDTSPRCPAPLMGQHNRLIAGGLGYSAAEVDALERDGVLYAEPVVAKLKAA